MSEVAKLEKALQIANQAGLSAEELERLERQELFWLSKHDDLNAATRRAKAEGLQRGLEQGLEQGREQGKKLGREEEKKAITKWLPSADRSPMFKSRFTHRNHHCYYPIKR